MRSRGRPQRFVLQKALKHLIRLQPELPDLFFLLPVRIAEPDIILMRAETSLLHQLRNGDLRVDGAAHADIAVPLRGRRIIGRRGGKGDHSGALHLQKEGLQRLPPFVFQMVALIQTDGSDPGLLHLFHEGKAAEIHRFPVRAVPVLLRLLRFIHRGKQRLIGQRGDQPGPADVVGKEGLFPGSAAGCRRFHKDVFRPFQPLLPDHQSGRKDQTGLSRPADQLDAESGLPRARRGHDMDLSVLKAGLSLIQDPFLIASPASLKFQDSVKYVSLFRHCLALPPAVRFPPSEFPPSETTAGVPSA